MAAAAKRAPAAIDHTPRGPASREACDKDVQLDNVWAKS